MEKPTDKQIKTRKKYIREYANGWNEFNCPSCSTEQPIPQIENPGEEQTQVHCNYGCGYIFLD